MCTERHAPQHHTHTHIDTYTHACALHTDPDTALRGAQECSQPPDLTAQGQPEPSRLCRQEVVTLSPAAPGSCPQGGRAGLAGAELEEAEQVAGEDQKGLWPRRVLGEDRGRPSCVHSLPAPTWAPGLRYKVIGPLEQPGPHCPCPGVQISHQAFNQQRDLLQGSGDPSPAPRLPLRAALLRPARLPAGPAPTQEDGAASVI